MQNLQLLKYFILQLPDLFKLKWKEYIADREGEVDLEYFSTWVEKIVKAVCLISFPTENQVTKEMKNMTRKLSTPKSMNAFSIGEFVLIVN